ncbi:MAG: hypothetical protein KKA42_08765 [candidate division Zixibacteria bacterium]|nr:hypothetical protein [candidate division Zixibacteria bacterium]
MSHVPIGAIVGASTAITAAAAARRQAEEEENMTRYDDKDINGYEFKIVRSNMGRFSNREVVERLRQEEARAGWELLEKFDQHRIRFKRKIEHRSMDAQLDFDPYRTSLGSGKGSAVVLMAVLGVGLVLAGVLFFALRYNY